MTRRRSPIVLHVDDSGEVRRAIGRVLVRGGFAVVEADTGADGLASAERVRPDLVILDVDLPDLSGLRVCERLRADPRTRHIPVLHLSGARVGVSDRVTGLEGGADAYLTHPVDPAELIATVRALIRVRLAEEREKQVQRRARSASRARDDAVSAVAQLLGPPLSVIGINLEGVLAALPAGDSVARSRGGALQEAARAATQILAELGDLARLEAGRSPPAPEATAVVPVLTGILARLAARAERRRVNFRSLFPSDELRALCEPPRLEQLVSALVGDAVEASAVGGVIEIDVAPDGPDVALTVRYRPGAARRGALSALAERFWDPSRVRRGPDALSLGVARAVVIAHGGQIWTDEKDGVVAVSAVLPGPAPRVSTGSRPNR